MQRTLVALVWFLASAIAPAFAATPPNPSPKPTASETSPDQISIDFPNREIRSILRDVADIFELNLVVPEELSGRTSVKLRNVTWRQIFREVLDPIGYTFIEDENIVRVLPIATNLPENGQFRGRSRLQDFPYAFALTTLPYLLTIPICMVQLILFIAVLRDRLEIPPRFLPQWLWAMMVLVGGILPLLAYWLMHHSTLARTVSQDTPPKIAQ